MVWWWWWWQWWLNFPWPVTGERASPHPILIIDCCRCHSAEEQEDLMMREWQTCHPNIIITTTCNCLIKKGDISKSKHCCLAGLSTLSQYVNPSNVFVDSSQFPLACVTAFQNKSHHLQMWKSYDTYKLQSHEWYEENFCAFENVFSICWKIIRTIHKDIFATSIQFSFYDFAYHLWFH